jgi:putative ABC transport system ATP-binding protein
VVLADEPTANLDSATGHAVAEVLAEVAEGEGRALLVVSHDERLLDVASRVARVEDGRLHEQAAR